MIKLNEVDIKYIAEKDGGVEVSNRCFYLKSFFVLYSLKYTCDNNKLLNRCFLGQVSAISATIPDKLCTSKPRDDNKKMRNPEISFKERYFEILDIVVYLIKMEIVSISTFDDDTDYFFFVKDDNYNKFILEAKENIGEELFNETVDIIHKTINALENHLSDEDGKGVSHH